MRKSVFILAATAAVLIHPALAEHGKVGAWHLETQTKASDPRGALNYMPSFQAIAIKDAFRKKTKSDYCMDAAAVAADVIVVPMCSVGPTTVSGNTMSANYSCTGTNAGSGRMTVTYDSPEHYSGESTYTPVKGMGVDAYTTYDGKWVGETCPAAPAN
ncbi:MAG TPA: DUF3617 family protein [Rhizomicrobium sp.]|jgi:hypothetical protein|nr:DUF3617 family protein [Rhizomicrobium sp.]